MQSYRQAVLRAADLIEQHLRSPIPLTAIARRAGYSLWHFHRIFAEATGESLGAYIRRRRLTVAAEELRATARPILELALDFQFESHEAFTRAFRAQFDVTPSTFRRTGHLAWRRQRHRLTVRRLQRLPRQTSMEPTLVQLPKLHLLGLSTRFIGPNSPDADNLDVIPRLYQRFCPLLPTLPQPLERCIYGAARCPADSVRRHLDELEYLAAVSVSAATTAQSPLVLWTLPAATYAQFTHRGPVAKLGETIAYAFGSWLPRSGYVHTGGANLDRQDERFGDGGAACIFDYLIPVRPR